MNRCHCLIRHAQTPKEREWAKRNLESARANLDPIGIMVYLAALTKCPNDNTKPNPEKICSLIAKI